MTKYSILDDDFMSLTHELVLMIPAHMKRFADGPEKVRIPATAYGAERIMSAVTGKPTTDAPVHRPKSGVWLGRSTADPTIWHFGGPTKAGVEPYIARRMAKALDRAWDEAPAARFKQSPPVKPPACRKGLWLPLRAADRTPFGVLTFLLVDKEPEQVTVAVMENALRA